MGKKVQYGKSFYRFMRRKRELREMWG